MFKAVFFDLDNTLYNYDNCHNLAINYVFDYIANINNLAINKIKLTFEEIKKQVKINLNNNASSHSRIIYFKNLVNKLNINLSPTILNDLYWEKFYNNIEENDNITNLLKLFKSIGIKLGIITNFTTEIQYKKLEKLGILELFDHIITSEETGLEKPHEYIYLKLKEEFNCEPNEILMIGDSLNDDILPALRLNFNCCHLNFDQNDDIIYHKRYISFNSTSKLYEFWNNFIKELIEFVNYSKLIGERYDLVQAGGGNISFKYENLMVIKASGVCLSDVNLFNGFSILYNKELKENLNHIIKPLSEYQIINTNNNSSIETYMHCFLKKITIHIHPIIFLRYLVSNQTYITDFKDILSNWKAILIEYYEPGLDLAYNILKYYNNNNIILLRNHGIIVTGDNWKQVFNLINIITIQLECKLNINLDRYRFCNNISTIINKKDFIRKKICYYSEDCIINSNLEHNLKLFNKNCFPDKLIYCGKKNLEVILVDELYKKYNNETIIILNNKLYIIANNLKKCKQIEEVIKANLLILTDNSKTIYNFTEKQINALLNRDDEKYRQNL